MKNRLLGSWLTTIIGGIIGLAGLAFLWFNKMSIWEAIPMWLLAWTFMAAKDSLLEGLTAGLLKFKKDDTN